MSILQEMFTLQNGVKIPKIGFGTWQLPQSIAEETVCTAIETGYRHIDTAIAYENERGVGAGIRKSGVPREEIFVTSKIPAEIKSYEGAKKCVEESLDRLGVGYIDLMLIHAPRPWWQMHAGLKTPYHKSNVAVWNALEEAYAAGKFRAIGVSNFAPSDLKNIEKNAKIQPMVNQIKAHAGKYPAALVGYCEEKGILVEGYSPLGTGKLLKNPNLKTLAEKYGATVPQLCVRFLLQKGVLPLPKTTHREYMAQNAAVDFQISAEDMQKLEKIQKR